MITVDESKDICNKLNYPYYAHGLVLNFSEKYNWADMEFYEKLISIKTKPTVRIVPTFEVSSDKREIDPFTGKFLLFNAFIEDCIYILKELRNFDNKLLE